MPTGYDLGDTRITINNGGGIDVASGADIDIASGGALKLAGTAITSNATELNQLDGTSTIQTDLIGSLTLSVPAEDPADHIVVSGQLKDMAGTNMAETCLVLVYISDDDDGSSVADTAPDDVLIGTDGNGSYGTNLYEFEADKMLLVLTDSSGRFDVDIQEDGSDTWYIVAQPWGGRHLVSGAVAF